MPWRVALLHNLRRGGGGIEAEYDAASTVEAVGAALEAGGHLVLPLEADLDLWGHLRSEPPDIAFNMAEGGRGEAREAHVPAMLEMLGIPYTGSRLLTLAVCLDKPTANALLRAGGVPTPQGAVLRPGPALARRAALLRYPVLCKPAAEGSSLGVAPSSLCASPAEVAAEVGRLYGAFGGAVLAEEFLPGREFTVGILGNGRPRLLPPLEIDYGQVPAGYPAIYSREFKQSWDEDRYYLCPAPVGPELRARLRRVALAAHRVLGCLDVARIDLRLDAAGDPRVLEVNPMPGLVPAFSDLPRMALAAGIGFEELVNGILESAARRWGLPPAAPRRGRQQPPG